MDNNGNNHSNKSWVKKARENNQAIDDSLNTKIYYGYEVVAVLRMWIVKSFRDGAFFGENKGESTDQYMKVKTQMVRFIC